MPAIIVSTWSVMMKVMKTMMSGGYFCLQVYTGKLSLVDLAGSERASETNNVGRQLKDGANINRYTCVRLLLLFQLL